MKFEGLIIEKITYGKDKGKFSGRIHFGTENNDSIYLQISPEYATKFVELALPLFERATSEKIEIIREELGLNK